MNRAWKNPQWLELKTLTAFVILYTSAGVMDVILGFPEEKCWQKVNRFIKEL